MYSKKVNIKIIILVLVNIIAINLAYFSGMSTADALSKMGSRGPEVKQIQEKLKSLGFYKGNIDSIYGSKTRAAVIAFQKSKKLTPDGIAGPKTLAALGIVTGGTILKQGSNGPQVINLQQKLKTLGFYKGNVDGVFGPQTRAAVVAFQKSKKLTPDGIAGPKTLAALGLTTHNPQSRYSDSDYRLLARTVSAEAKGEPYLGQVAVAAVILNRVEHPSFPNTIPSVIYQPKAFSVVERGMINEPPSESAYRAAQDALNGMDPSGGSIFFYNPKKTTSAFLRSRPKVVTIGTHVFCK